MFIIPYNFWRFLTFTVLIMLMVKPDILRQRWLNYRGRNITGCECARDYLKKLYLVMMHILNILFPFKYTMADRL